MRKTICLLTFISMVVVVASSCGPPPAANNAGNTANRPANAANNAATAPANAAAVEAEIKKLANDGVAAILKNDTAALEKMWADNYTFISQDGAVATKAQRIESMKSGQSKIEALSYDDMSVRSNPEGTGAVLTGVVNVKGTNMGKPVDGRYRFTQVWGKMADGWRSVHGQVTPIVAAAADTKPAANTSTASNAAKPPPPPPANK